MPVNWQLKLSAFEFTCEFGKGNCSWPEALVPKLSEGKLREVPLLEA
jgi:hypothetical protein